MSYVLLCLERSTEQILAEIVSPDEDDSELRTSLLSKMRCLVAEPPTQPVKTWSNTRSSFTNLQAVDTADPQCVFGVAVSNIRADESATRSLLLSVKDEVAWECTVDIHGERLHPNGIRSKAVLGWRLASLTQRWLCGRLVSSPTAQEEACVMIADAEGAEHEGLQEHGTAEEGPLLQKPVAEEVLSHKPAEEEPLQQPEHLQLVQAAADGDVAEVSRLLSCRVDPNRATESWSLADGGTALGAACHANHEECVKELISAGGCTSQPDYLGLTPYDRALRRGWTVLAEESLAHLDGGRASCGRRWLEQADGLLDEFASVSDPIIVRSLSSAVQSTVPLPAPTRAPTPPADTVEAAGPGAGACWFSSVRSCCYH